jgi:diadenosine tetraphosphate (Ap4A) HIT family hydrolase
MEVNGCFGCRVARGEITPPGGVFSVSPNWTLNWDADRPQRPWFVLQTNHHRSDLGDLTVQERDELGRVLPSVADAIRNFTGASRVYAAIFNELGHVHVHLVPRFATDTASGPDLFRVGSPIGVDPATGADCLAAIAEQAGFDPEWEPHAIVRCLVALHKQFNQRVSPYEKLMRRFWPARYGTAAFAPVYVCMWLIVLLSLLAVTAINHVPWWVRVLVAAVATFRFVDAVVYEVGILLDRSQNWLSGLERSVILAAANLLEISIIGAIWLLALRWGATVGPTWVHTIGLVTTSDGPRYTGAVAGIAQVITLGGGLVFLAGGIALLIGALGSRMREIRSAR